ncbi:MAG: hypothetical protein RSC30_07185, partial [Oscillospiraceae bacterium]
QNQLEIRKQDESEAGVDDQILEQLAGLVKAEIPQAMIERRMDESVNEFAYRMQSQGMELDTYLQFTGMTRDSFRESLREKSETQVKINLGLDKVVELENIVVTDEAIENEYNRLAEMYGVEADVVKKAIPVSEATSGLKTTQALEIIKKTAKITEEKVAKKASGDVEEKKPAAKKPAAKKPAAKKPAAKKDTEEKVETKKPAAKKAAAKKTEEK